MDTLELNADKLEKLILQDFGDKSRIRVKATQRSDTPLYQTMAAISRLKSQQFITVEMTSDGLFINLTSYGQDRIRDLSSQLTA